jgi:heme oxygenase
MSAPLSRALHEATRDVHERAERTPLMVGLLDGSRTVDDWAALLGQLEHVYRALEAPIGVLGAHPGVGPFLHPALPRAAALRADLADLRGADPRGVDPRGADQLAAEPLPATRRYVMAIESVVAGAHVDPAAFVAHHWVRYLGDLSGGQALRVLLGRSLGLPPERVRFYDFGELRPKAFKDDYHALLDATGWDPAAMAGHAVAAFELNCELFAAVDAARDGGAPQRKAAVAATAS